MKNNIKKHSIIALILSGLMGLLQFLIYFFNDLTSYFYLGNAVYYMMFLCVPFIVLYIYRFFRHKERVNALYALSVFGFFLSLYSYYSCIIRFDGDVVNIGLLKKPILTYFLLFLFISIMLHFIINLRDKNY